MLDTTLNQFLEDDICRKLSKVELSTTPYPHFFAEDFFTPLVYKQIRSLLPDDDCYEYNSRQPSLKSRRHFNLDPSRLELLIQTKRNFWVALFNALTGERFTGEMKRKFKYYLLKRYGNLNFETKTRVELIRDTCEWEIQPHSDHPSKVFTLLFYLPEDNSLYNYGTSVYMPKDQSFVDDRGTRFPYEKFLEYKRFNFIPNSVFAFMKNERSFHGRPKCAGMTQYRDWMNCSIKLTDFSTEIRTSDKNMFSNN